MRSRMLALGPPLLCLPLLLQPLFAFFHVAPSYPLQRTKKINCCQSAFISLSGMSAYPKYRSLGRPRGRHVLRMEADGGWPTAHGDGDDSGYHNGIPSDLSSNGNSEVSEDGTGSLSSPPFVPFPLFPFSDCGEAAMAQFPDMTDEGLHSDVEGSTHECGDGEKRTRGTDITGRGGRALGGRVPWIEVRGPSGGRH